MLEYNFFDSPMYRRNKYEGTNSVYFFSETRKLFQVNQNGKGNIMH